MKEYIKYRELFNGIETEIQLSNGAYRIPINFDNAATTPPLKRVDEFIYNNILMYGSVGRGGQKASYCTKAYTVSREEILRFFKLTPKDGYTAIYVRNATEGFNLLANLLCEKKNTKVLSTRMEHHANDLPWRRTANMFYAEVDGQGRIDLPAIEEKLAFSQGTIKYVTVTGASNVTGYITPIHEIAKISHRYGARLVVDAAQLVAHKAINMKGYEKDDYIDFLVFSGHKMYAPFGSGVVIGPKEVFDAAPPYLVGGGTVTTVFDDDVYWKPAPEKDEAGTPNFLGAMAIVAAMTVLKEVGFEKIEEHEEALKNRLLKGLSELPQVVLYGDKADPNRLGVVSFNIKKLRHDEVSRYLAETREIAVRNGCFCAQPYVTRLLGISDKERYQYMQEADKVMPGMVRASMGLYNTEEEVDEFLNIIETLTKRTKKTH